MKRNDLAAYSGTGKAFVANGSSLPVSFAVGQSASSDLDGLCELEGNNLCYEDVVRIAGTTVDGWSIIVDCGPPAQNAHAWHRLSLTPQTITVTRPGADPPQPLTASGPLLNLRLPNPHQRWERQVPWRGYDLDISVIAGYHDRISELEETNGILQTATLVTEMQPNLSIEETWKQLAAISSPLSLATGHLVTLAGLDVADADGRPYMRFHANAITHPFRTHAPSFGTTTNPRKIVLAWDTPTTRLFPLELIPRRISQYLDSVMSALFLDSRAMLSVCLLDSLSKQYYKVNGKKETYLKARLITMIGELGIEIELPDEVGEGDDEQADEAEQVDDIFESVKKSRDNLVHEGVFTANGPGLEKVWETIQPHWLSFAILTRLVDPKIGIRPIYKVKTEEGTFESVSDYNL